MMTVTSRYSYFRLLLVAVISAIVAMLCQSCIMDDQDSTANSGVFPEGTDTYFNFVLHFGNEGTRGTPEAGDTSASAAENAVKNVAVVLFGGDDKFEKLIELNQSDLTKEDGTGNLGSSVTNGYTFTKAVAVKAGQKTVFAVVNCNPFVLSKLHSFLTASTTLAQFENYQIDLLPSGATFPKRLDLPKYGNYVAPAPNGYIDLTRLGVVDDAPSTANGMIMSGFNTVNIEAGVSVESATAGEHNLVTIYVDRLAAKVTVRFDESMTYDYVQKSSSQSSLKYYAMADGHNHVYQAVWWPANMPDREYTNEHTAGSYTPYYNESSNFSHWQNANALQVYYNNPLNADLQDAHFTDSRALRLDKTGSTTYMPENVVSKPVRGNTSCIVVKAQFSPDRTILDDVLNYFIRLSATDTTDGIAYFRYRGQYAFNAVVGWSLPILDFATVTSFDWWVLTDENGGKIYYPVCKPVSLLTQYPGYFDDVVIHKKVPAALTNVFLWWYIQAPTLFYDDNVPFNNDDPKTVFHCDMTTLAKDKATQDAVALAKSYAEGSSAGVLNPGYYVFYYDAKALHSGKWYDEIYIYHYDGTKNDAGEWNRTLFKTYTAGFYNNCTCYYRINLEDVTKDKYAFDRYAVNRNDWYDVIIKKINEIGYPDEEDLFCNPEDEVSASWLEVEISVQDWRDGGEQSGTATGN